MGKHTIKLELEVEYTTDYVPSCVVDGHGYHEIGDYITISLNSANLIVNGDVYTDLLIDLKEGAKNAILDIVSKDY
jgi:hypothetical protein